MPGRCGRRGAAASSAENPAQNSVFGPDGDAGSGPSLPLEQEGEVAGIRIVQERAGALVEDVGVEAFGPEQRYAPLPIGALGLQRRKLGREPGDLLVEVVLGLEPVIAGIGVDAKIADQ